MPCCTEYSLSNSRFATLERFPSFIGAFWDCCLPNKREKKKFMKKKMKIRKYFWNSKWNTIRFWPCHRYTLHCSFPRVFALIFSSLCLIPVFFFVFLYSPDAIAWVILTLNDKIRVALMEICFIRSSTSKLLLTYCIHCKCYCFIPFPILLCSIRLLLHRTRFFYSFVLHETR